MSTEKIGIDFGNCNIKVAKFTKRPIPIKIDNDDSNRDNKIANAIKYRSRNDFIIGNKALDDSEGEIVENIKRKIELEEFTQNFDGFSLNAEEIACDIFSSIKTAIDKKINNIGTTVITVPVCFTEVQKNRIKTSASKALIDVSAVISEPVAALFSIESIFEDECNETILVFDFGSSTLDLCLFEVSNDGDNVDIDIKTSVGLRLGGVDITDIIYNEIVLVKYKDFVDDELQLETTGVIAIKKELYKITEIVKQDLFEDEEDEAYQIYTSVNSKNQIEIEITLDEVVKCFEKHNLKEKITQLLDDMFQDPNADFYKEDITLIKTFGGTSRILYFRDILEEYFDLEIDDYDHDSAYQSIALGACKYADIISNSDENSHINIINSISFHAGINKDGEFLSIVEKNQKYGFFKPLRNLSSYLDNATDFTITLYQSFKAEDVSIGSDDGAVFLSKIVLDKSKYQQYEQKNLLCNFGVNNTGQIVARFHHVDEKNDIIFIEEKEF